ncbi:MAG: hypothetical protein ACRDO7_15310 [Nocardioidaceae bacterium]
MRAHRVIAPVAAAGLLVGALGAPADADVRTFKDRRGDVAGSIDITRVRVDNSTKDRQRVLVRVKQRRFEFGDHIFVYFDTRRDRRGPEFRLRAYYASEYFLERMRSWNKRGKSVRCGGAYSLKMGGSGVSRAVVDRRCLGRPGAIRVAVRTGRDGPGHDWARAKQRWLAPVRLTSISRSAPRA